MMNPVEEWDPISFSGLGVLIESGHVQSGIVPDDKIFLGFRHKISPNELRQMSPKEIRREIVTLPYDFENPSNILVTGRQGTGKTYLAGNIMFLDNIIRRFRMRGYMVDPAGEYISAGHLTKNAIPNRVWNMVGLGDQVRSVPLLPYSPRVCNKKDEKGFTYMLETEKITLQTLFQILNIEGENSESTRHREVIRNALKEYIREKTGDEEAKVPNETMLPNYFDLLEFVKKVSRGPKAAERIENLWNTSTIGYGFPPPDIISAMKDGIVPVLKTSKKQSLKSLIGSLVRYEMDRVIDEKDMYYDGKSDGLPYPVQFLIDEYGVVITRREKEFYKELYDRLRKLQIGVIGMNPRLMDFGHEIVDQQDYIITARIPMNSKDEKHIRDSLNDTTLSENVGVLNNLEDLGKGRNAQPHEFALINNRSGDLMTFFPSLSVSGIRQKRGKKGDGDMGIYEVVEISKSNEDLFKERIEKRIKHLPRRQFEIMTAAKNKYPEPLTRKDILNLGVKTGDTSSTVKPLLTKGYLTRKHTGKCVIYHIAGILNP